MIGANATIESGVVIRRNVIVDPNARIGRSSTLQVLVTIERDVQLGEFVEIGQVTVIHYNAVVESYADILGTTTISFFRSHWSGRKNRIGHTHRWEVVCWRQLYS